MGYILSDRGSNSAERWGPIRKQDHVARLDPDTLRDLRRTVEALEAHKAHDVILLDLRRVSDAADVFVIASGTSDTHVRALAERVLEAVERGGGHAHHAEGVRAGRWALLDFVNVVVHVFHPTLRAYYQLERLWVDAPQLAAASLQDGPPSPSAADANRASRRTG